jgi:hypothetical protein
LTERLNQPAEGAMSGHIMMEGDTTTQLLGARKEIHDLLHSNTRARAQRNKGRITELVCHITAASASVSSDKIFALHGMIKALGVTLPQPDYKLPTSEVYWKASCVLMRSQNCLAMLSIVNGSREFPGYYHWPIILPRLLWTRKLRPTIDFAETKVVFDILDATVEREVAKVMMIDRAS